MFLKELFTWGDRTSTYLTMAGLIAVGGLPLQACGRAHADDDLPPPTGSGAPAVPAVVSPAPVAAEQSQPRGLTAIGTARAVHSAELAAEAAGVLRKIYVDEGDRVKKGQVLFQIDSASQGLDVRQSDVSFDAARLTLRSAEREYQRDKSLQKSGAISAAALQQTRDRYHDAKVAVERARVAVSTARTTASQTIVRSPLDGIVSAKMKNQGESVGKHGDAVLTVHDNSRLEVRARLVESALAKIRPGDPVRVTFDAVGITHDVELDRINPTVDEKTRTVEVVAIVDNDDGVLKAGMLVRLEFPKVARRVASDAGRRR